MRLGSARGLSRQAMPKRERREPVRPAARSCEEPHREKGLENKVDLEFRDYRDITGSFDRIVSIEMIEAVGQAFWPDYFQTLYDRIRPGGTVVLQAITIDERASTPIAGRRTSFSAMSFQAACFPQKRHCAGSRKSWPLTYVFGNIRRELRANAVRMAAAFRGFLQAIEAMGFSRSSSACGTTT